jgi:hypothetical protein
MFSRGKTKKNTNPEEPSNGEPSRPGLFSRLKQKFTRKNKDGIQDPSVKAATDAHKAEQLEQDKQAGLTRVPGKTLKSRLMEGFGNLKNKFTRKNNKEAPDSTAKTSAVQSTLTPGPVQDIASQPKDIRRPSKALPPLPPPRVSSSQPPPLPPPRVSSSKPPPPPPPRVRPPPPRVPQPPLPQEMDPLSGNIPVNSGQTGGNVTRKNSDQAGSNITRNKRQYIHEIKENRTQLFNKEMEIINSIRNFKHVHVRGHNENGKTKPENIQKKFIKVIKRS